MRTRDNNYYSYDGDIYWLFLETSVEVGAVKLSNDEKMTLADLQLIPKRKWKKAILIPKQIAKRLIAIKF